jgi:hypothetical protein
MVKPAEFLDFAHTFAYTQTLYALFQCPVNGFTDIRKINVTLYTKLEKPKMWDYALWTLAGRFAKTSGIRSECGPIGKK